MSEGGMRWMIEDRIRREGVPADMVTRDFRLRADSVSCAGQQYRSVSARLLGARAVAVAAPFNSYRGVGCAVGRRWCTARARPRARPEGLIDRWEGK